MPVIKTTSLEGTFEHGGTNMTDHLVFKSISRTPGKGNEDEKKKRLRSIDPYMNHVDTHMALK